MTLENIDIPTGMTGETTRNNEELPFSEEMTLAVSPVCQKDGKQYAFVTFSVAGENGDTAQGKMAEGKIPECKIISNKGFSEKEVEQLERYMKRELTRLKKMASSVNVLEAFMK